MTSVKNPFSGIRFLKPGIQFRREPSSDGCVPMFRASFEAQPGETAVLYLCVPGFGECFLNGAPVTADRFETPFGDFRKTLWYRAYDVTALLRPGRNTAAVFCGNGWYNEALKSSWDCDAASWRDLPKFILNLTAGGRSLLTTNDPWKCLPHTAVTFSQLRSGEYFDARLWQPDWAQPAFDDSGWEDAAEDLTPPAGVFRLCESTPVRECEVLSAVSVRKTGEKKWLFDVGRNISGYVRLHTKEPAGTVLTIRYGEELGPDDSLKLNRMERFYPASPFQTDRFTAGGSDFLWSPRFVYHGFRYVEITGLEAPLPDAVSGVFVHNAARMLTSFRCSEESLNQLFRMAQNATMSNLFHMPTDCPTREKLGWTNDAQSSCDQMLLNFDTVPMFRKWMTDIRDAMREDGALPGIVPTWGWGYQWGAGPVSDGILFEVPYRVWLHTGDASLLKEFLPDFEKYLAYAASRKNADGLTTDETWLWDWAAPLNDRSTPLPLVHTVYVMKFLRIAALAARLSGQDDSRFLRERSALRELLRKAYLTPEGRCTAENQAAPALLLSEDIPDDPLPLAEQLAESLRAADYHITCGMAALRVMYPVLNRFGLQEYAFRIVTAQGYPSYREWIARGGTTLHELWEDRGSKNHHMYSSFAGWMMNTILGIGPQESAPGFAKLDLRPYFFGGLAFACGSAETVRGCVSLRWERVPGGVKVTVQAPPDMEVSFRGTPLHAGENVILVPAE